MLLFASLSLGPNYRLNSLRSRFVFELPSPVYIWESVQQANRMRCGEWSEFYLGAPGRNNG